MSVYHQGSVTVYGPLADLCQQIDTTARSIAFEITRKWDREQEQGMALSRTKAEVARLNIPEPVVQPQLDPQMLFIKHKPIDPLTIMREQRYELKRIEEMYPKPEPLLLTKKWP